MSVGVSTFSPTFSVSREEAEVEADAVDFDRELYASALALCAAGEVGFKIARRVDASALPAPKRRVFSVLRLLPRRWFVPPALAKQKGFYDLWFDAVNACKTSDYQLLVMPRNRSYEDDEDDECDKKWDVAVECRPRDPTDAKRFKTLQKVFGACPAPVDIREIEDRLTVVEERLAKLVEAAKGT
jgi:hypothetical protein